LELILVFSQPFKQPNQQTLNEIQFHFLQIQVSQVLYFPIKIFKEYKH